MGPGALGIEREEGWRDAGKWMCDETGSKFDNDINSDVVESIP